MGPTQSLKFVQPGRIFYEVAINSVYTRYFPLDPPTRSFVCVSPWHGHFDVEIDCVALINDMMLLKLALALILARPL
jgi:hypothetical protein